MVIFLCNLHIFVLDKMNRLYRKNDHLWLEAKLTLLLLNTTCPVLANSVDPDQLASEEANWSGSALSLNMWISIKRPGSSYLIGWKLEVGMAS